MARTPMLLLAAATGAAVLSACGSGTPSAAPSTTAPATTAPLTTAPATTAPGTTAPTVTSSAGNGGTGPGCAPDGTGVPAGVASGPTVDVDGDGRPDTAWLQDNADGSQLAGITTASGATFGAVYRSASPIHRRLLVADVDGAGTIAAIVTDGRQAGLFTVRSCTMVPVLNAQGAQYTFDLGFGGAGTGIGCSGLAGTGPGLVGLRLNLDPAGTPSSVTRTAVILDGTSARNGASDTVDVSGDPTGPAATTAGQITCGTLTMNTNGVG